MIIPAAASLLLTGLFLTVALYNAGVLFASRRGQPASSYLPLVGGLCGAAGVWAWPYHDLRPWAWLPLLLDPGCGYYLTMAISLSLRDKWRWREGLCLLRLIGESDNKRVVIRLYRNGRLRMEQTLNRPARIGSLSVAGTWTRPDTGNGYLLNVWGASIRLQARDGHWEAVEESGWRQDELSLSDLNLVSCTDEAGAG